MDVPSLIITLLLAFAVAFVVFLVIRQVVLWYWRINEMADNLAYIADHYRALDQQVARERIEQTRRATTQPSTRPLPG